MKTDDVNAYPLCPLVHPAIDCKNVDRIESSYRDPRIVSGRKAERKIPKKIDFYERTLLVGYFVSFVLLAFGVIWREKHVGSRLNAPQSSKLFIASIPVRRTNGRDYCSNENLFSINDHERRSEDEELVFIRKKMSTLKNDVSIFHHN